MAELRTVCAGLGHEDVATYLQSGNVVLRTAEPVAAVAAGLEAAIAERFGHPVSVIVRTHAELEAVAAASPFPADDPKKLHVLFLREQPKAPAVAALDPQRSPGDEFRVSGGEIFLYYPEGSGRTRLTLDYFERRLGTAGTSRNWNTVLKLVELTAP
jgi:uncharacterized protein (DUF1697 family)